MFRRSQVKCIDVFWFSCLFCSGLTLFLLGMSSWTRAEHFEKHYTPMIAYTKNLTWVDNSTMLSNITFFVNRTTIIKTINCPVYPNAVMDRVNCVYRPGTLFHVRFNEKKHDFRFNDDYHFNLRFFGIAMIIFGCALLAIFLALMFGFMTHYRRQTLQTSLLLGDM